MKTSDYGIKFIYIFEGFRSKPYQDSVGIWTIGFGSTRYADGTKVTEDDPEITKDEAVKLFKQTLVTYENCVTTFTKDVELTQGQFDSLVSFCYNLGCFNLQKSTLLKKIKADPNDKTIGKEFAKWNRAGGEVLAGLTRRRAAEAKLYFS